MSKALLLAGEMVGRHGGVYCRTRAGFLGRLRGATTPSIVLLTPSLALTLGVLSLYSFHSFVSLHSLGGDVRMHGFEVLVASSAVSKWYNMLFRLRESLHKVFRPSL